MNTVKYLLATLVLSSFTACGGKSEPAPEVGPLKQKDGPCGSTVIDDYNSVAISCSMVVTTERYNECRTKADDLMEKYPELNCTAESNRVIVGGESKALTINQDHMDDMVRKAYNSILTYPSFN